MILKIFSYGSTPDKLITKHLNPIIRKLGLTAPIWLPRLDLTSVPQDSILIVFGKDGFNQLKSLIPSFIFKSISSAVGKRIELNGITIMVSHDLEILESDYEYWTEIYWIFASISRYMTTGSYEYSGGTCTLVKTFNTDIEVIKEKHNLSGKRVPVVIDIESMGTIAYNSGVRIISVAITYEDGYGSVRYFTDADMDPYLDDLRWILTSPIIYGIGGNFKFDSQWFATKFGIETKNHEFDIVLAGSVLDETRSNSLKTLAKLETDMGGYEDDFVSKYDMAHMELVPVEDVVRYCGLDTIASLKVAKAILPKLREKNKLYNLYKKIVHPSSLAYEAIERRGVVIDKQRFSQLDVEFSKRLGQINKEALSLMPRRLAFKYKDTFSLKASVVADFLFSRAGLNITPKHMTESGKKASTSKEHLEEYIAVEEARPFITLFNEFVKIQKYLGTYIHGFLEHLRPDNMFHPNYLLFKGESDDSFGGTSTGRSSCKSPAFQCQRGKTLVQCLDGRHTIRSMVEGFEKGRSYIVKAHSGQWRKVIGVYRNGIQPVFEVTTRSGLVTGCTANHPLLLDSGFTRTDRVSVGDLVFTEKDWHGTATKAQPITTEVQQTHSRRESRVGADNCPRHDSIFSDQVRLDGPGGTDRTKTSYDRPPETQEGALEARKAGYVLDLILSVLYVGDEETYDLTVEVDHSFVADGIVVHNTIPKRGDLAKKLRSAYIAPPGHQIVSLDYDQGELRVIACVADEQNMIEIYRNNGDLHKTTGMAVKRIDEAAFQALTDVERSKLRDSGKATNFGVVYDISAEGYCNFARKSYGVILDLEEGQSNIDAFFGKFTRLRPWHDRYRAHARKHGFTESPLGRRKNLPLVNSTIPYVRGRELRRAINNPIQGCLNDLMLYTMARVYQQRPDIWAFGTIHDQGLFYVREETALEDALFIKDIMENLPLEQEFGWSPQVKFTAELKMGYVLSDLKKVKQG